MNLIALPMQQYVGWFKVAVNDPLLDHDKESAEDVNKEMIMINWRAFLEDTFEIAEIAKF